VSGSESNRKDTFEIGLDLNKALRVDNFSRITGRLPASIIWFVDEAKISLGSSSVLLKFLD
jgi:hypothetical protein